MSTVAWTQVRHSIEVHAAQRQCGKPVPGPQNGHAPAAVLLLRFLCLQRGRGATRQTNSETPGNRQDGEGARLRSTRTDMNAARGAATAGANSTTRPETTTRLSEGETEWRPRRLLATTRPISAQFCSLRCRAAMWLTA